MVKAWPLVVGPLQVQLVSSVGDSLTDAPSAIPDTVSELAQVAIHIDEDRTTGGPTEDATIAWDVWGRTPAWDAAVVFAPNAVTTRFSFDPAFVARFSRSRAVALQVLCRAALRLSLAVAAPFAGAALVHGAALVLPGAFSATLFIGPSGAGKTTITTRIPGAFVLADDTVLVWREGGQVFVTGTPLRGREGHPTRIAPTPLAAIVTLKPHAPEARLQPLGHAAAFGAFLDRTFYYPSPALPAEGQGLLFDLVATIVASVPSFELHSDLGHDVASLLARTEALHV